MNKLADILMQQHVSGEVSLSDLEDMNENCDGMTRAEVTALGQVLETVWAAEKEQRAAYALRKSMNDHIGLDTEPFKYVPPGPTISYAEFMARRRAKAA